MSLENNGYQNHFDNHGKTDNTDNTGYAGYTSNPGGNIYGHAPINIGSENIPVNTAPRSVPDYSNSYRNYSQTPPQPDIEPPKPPKEEKKPVGGAVKMIAAMAAVAVIAGASGGGVSYMILKNNPAIQTQLPVQNAAEEPVSSESPQQPSSQKNAANGASSVNDISGVVEKASESVVEISVEAKAMNPFFGQYASGGSGSGVILTADGYIVTNDHVVEGAEKITVRTKDGTEYEAKLIGTDTQTDLAVIKVEAENLKPATFGDSDTIKVGEVAIAIGNPLGTLGGTVTQGIISAKDREIDFETENGVETMSLIQTSAAVNPGNSGGGLFNSEGDLVGIVNAKSTGTNVEGLGFAIPANTVQAVTNDLIQNGYVSGRPQLGINVVEILDAQTAFRYRVNEPGVYVATATNESELKSGDLFVSIDGKEIKASADVKSAIAEKKVGDTVEVVVRRDGQEISVSITLTEKIPESIRQAIQNSEV